MPSCVTNVSIICILWVGVIRCRDAVPVRDDMKTPIHEYGEYCGYQSCPPVVKDVLNVHIVPTTHAEVGFTRNFYDHYYGRGGLFTDKDVNMKKILDAVVVDLWMDPQKKFTFSDFAYFFYWWSQREQWVRNMVHALVRTGRLNFVGGGWVINEEACASYHAIIDQFTFALRKLNNTFGECGRPLVAFQTEVLGHTREFASLVAQMGLDALLLDPLSYEDEVARARRRAMEFVWRGSDDLGPSTDIFTHKLFDGHFAPPGFCFAKDCTDPLVVVHDDSMSNADERADLFITQLFRRQAPAYGTRHVLVMMGATFAYHDAGAWFSNLDRLMERVNENSLRTDNMKMSLEYSTPACYVKAVQDSGIRLETKQDDFVPMNYDKQTSLVGGYTARPSIKYMAREGHIYLQIAKQLRLLAKLPNHNQKIEELQWIVSIFQDHRMLAGAMRSDVKAYYTHKMYIAIQKATILFRQAFNKLRDSPPQTRYYRCSFNVSSCGTSRNGQYFVTIYNPLSWNVTMPVRIPVEYGVFRVLDPDENEIDVSMMKIPYPVLGIPERSKRAGGDHELVFMADNLPPLGFRSYYVQEVQLPQGRAPSSRLTRETRDAYDVNANYRELYTDTGDVNVNKEKREDTMSEDYSSYDEVDASNSNEELIRGARDVDASQEMRRDNKSEDYSRYDEMDASNSKERSRVIRKRKRPRIIVFETDNKKSGESNNTNYKGNSNGTRSQTRDKKRKTTIVFEDKNGKETATQDAMKRDVGKGNTTEDVKKRAINKENTTEDANKRAVDKENTTEGAKKQAIDKANTTQDVKKQAIDKGNTTEDAKKQAIDKANTTQEPKKRVARDTVIYYRKHDSQTPRVPRNINKYQKTDSQTLTGTKGYKRRENNKIKVKKLTKNKKYLVRQVNVQTPSDDDDYDYFEPVTETPIPGIDVIAGFTDEIIKAAVTKSPLGNVTEKCIEPTKLTGIAESGAENQPDVEPEKAYPKSSVLTNFDLPPETIVTMHPRMDPTEQEFAERLAVLDPSSRNFIMEGIGDTRRVGGSDNELNSLDVIGLETHATRDMTELERRKEMTDIPELLDFTTPVVKEKHFEPVRLWTRPPLDPENTYEKDYDVENFMPPHKDVEMPRVQVEHEVPEYIRPRPVLTDSVFEKTEPPFKPFVYSTEAEVRYKAEEPTEAYVREETTRAPAPPMVTEPVPVPVRTELPKRKLKMNYDGIESSSLFIENDYIRLIMDPVARKVESMKLSNGVLTTLDLQFYYYVSDPKGKTDDILEPGTFVFRSKDNNAVGVMDYLDVQVYKSPIVEEIHYIYSNWASLAVRLYRGQPFIEVDWVVGPVPVDKKIGKEVFIRYTTNLKNNGVFYTDSNGRQTMKRIRNSRPMYQQGNADYVAGNIYPVTSKIYIEDVEQNVRFSVFNDRAQGGSSIYDGTIDLFLHRRILTDDSRQQATLDETYGQSQGITVRGKHYLYLSKADYKPNKIFEKKFAKELELSPKIFVSDRWPYGPESNLIWAEQINELSFMEAHLPIGVHVLSLEDWDDDTVLLRLENYLEKSDTVRAGKKTVILRELFANLKIYECNETTLGGNIWLKDYTPLEWRLKDKFLTNFNLHYGNATGKARFSENDRYTKPMGPVNVDKGIVLYPQQIRTFVCLFIYQNIEVRK